MDVWHDPHAEYVSKTETTPGGWKDGLYVSFRAGPRFNQSAAAGRLVDAINAGGIDSERCQHIIKTQAKLRKRMEKLDWELKDEKLRAAAAVRHQYPIARVTAAPLADIPKLQS